MKKSIDYWGTGFRVRLIEFPVYEDEGWFGPDVPLNPLHEVIARKLLARQRLLTGDELAFLRALADLTRSEAARRLGVTRRTLINWEDRNELPIGAQPLVHLGLRAAFFGWLFPDHPVRTSAMHLATDYTKEPLVVTYAEMDEVQEEGIGPQPVVRTKFGGFVQPQSYAA
jgi:transcriptional regulator with XRE-family HTH domain